MSEDAMLVRMPGGDVIRRPVAARHVVHIEHGTFSFLSATEEPELRGGERLLRTMSDPIPQIIFTK